MPQYCVRYYMKSTTSARCELTVEAQSPEEARKKVEAHFSSEEDVLSDDELMSEYWGKEEVLDNEFIALEDEDEPFAVMEVV